MLAQRSTGLRAVHRRQPVTTGACALFLADGSGRLAGVAPLLALRGTPRCLAPVARCACRSSPYTSFWVLARISAAGCETTN